MYKRKFTIFLLILVLVFAFFNVKAGSQPKTYNVKLTEKGFEPALLNIKKGDKIVFESISNNFFWPASDLHPSHLVYPDFDSGQGVPKGQSWTFEFNKVGKWEYHDHLSPTNRGVVVVNGIFNYLVLADDLTKKTSDLFIKLTGEDKYSENVIKKCAGGTSFQDKRKCWELSMSDVERNFGIDATFKFLGKAIKKDDNLSGTCHYYAEYIGFLAYERYYKGESPKIYKDADLCAYGYYHAFLQEWISHAKDFDSAREYCNVAGIESSSRFNCVLGMGIGLTFLNISDYYTKDDWVVKKSIEQCRHIYKDSIEDLDICIDGVFSGLAHLYFGDHGLSLKVNKDNPYWVCDTLTKDLKNRCYPELTETIYFGVNRDQDIVSKHILANPDKNTQIASFERLGITFYNTTFFEEKENTRNVDSCNSLKNFLAVNSCKLGFVRRHISYVLKNKTPNSNDAFVCNEFQFSKDTLAMCERELNNFLKNNEQGF